MSYSGQTLRDVVAAYDHSLEKQIMGRGTNLACRDQELWNQVQGLLTDGITEETHCSGLDPLRVMEESLMEAAAAVSAHSGGQVKARGGLQGLAKAFEVLEQAALNLYLSPWREEYKVVKMYSGMFTHYIKPVLSMPQIEKVFGLLGYKPSSSRQEQLHLHLSTTSPASLDDLLRICCAFYLARCECCLLVTALGNQVGEAEWELSMVRERQKGHSIQVALENTIKILKVNQPVMRPLDAEVDVDLYTDEQANGGQREVGVVDSKGPRSLKRVTESSAPLRAVTMLSSGMMSLPSPSTEHACISMLNCQLIKTSPEESDTPRSSSISKRQDRHLYEESKFDKADLQSQSRSLQLEVMGLGRREAEGNQLCNGLQLPNFYPNHCAERETLHSIRYDFVDNGSNEGHHMINPDRTTETINGSALASPQSESLRVNNVSASQTLTSSSTAMSSLALCDHPKSIIPSIQPITYHHCCNLTQLDPRVLCISCCVFHTHTCREQEYCKIHHTVKELGVCKCGKRCSRNPLVLCRYCGNEYCTACWYRSPVKCECGQTFDQSSSV